MTRLTMILSFFILGCHYSNNDGAALHLTHSESKDILKTADTLSDPNSNSYLTNLPLRQVANLILNDSIRPSDNKVTFDCMDSIYSSNIETRNFYFPVFLKILDKADGALAEAVGGYIKTYVEKYPKELIEKTNQLTDEQFQSLASYTGDEVYYTYDTEEGDNKWKNNVLKKCSDCDSIQLRRLRQFIKLAIAARKKDAKQ